MERRCERGRRVPKMPMLHRERGVVEREREREGSGSAARADEQDHALHAASQQPTSCESFVNVIADNWHRGEFADA